MAGVSAAATSAVPGAASARPGLQIGALHAHAGPAFGDNVVAVVSHTAVVVPTHWSSSSSSVSFAAGRVAVAPPLLQHGRAVLTTTPLRYPMGELALYCHPPHAVA